MKNSAKIASTLTVLAVTGTSQAAVIFGLNDAGGIYAINPNTGESTLYRSTVANPNGQLNALSYNTQTDTFYYITQGDSKVYQSTATATSVLTSLPSGNIANAAYYGGKLWLVRDGVGKMFAIDIQGPTPVLSEYTISGIGKPTFGDIAVDAGGTLFGATNGRLFSLDLNTITSTTRTIAVTTITSDMVNLQLGFISGTLYGIQTDTDKIFNINTTTGARTEVTTLANTSLKINDAASVIPEPSALAALALGSLMTLRRRRSV